ncbi:MAG: zf-HC2 domain-containing protein [Candidatus Aminicenantes bacterium]|nr:zf-HC2 domain-containing protein [Candidatus Aminicenantes bacterium]
MKITCKKARKNISLALDCRLQMQALTQLQTHLDVCPACRDWQQEQLWLLKLLQAPQISNQPSVDFYKMLQSQINESPGQPKLVAFLPSALRPSLLRAAMLLILILSALFGFILSGRLDAGAIDSTAMVFSRTVNLEAFADLPAESFGAVYAHLLQGERP